MNKVKIALYIALGIPGWLLGGLTLSVPFLLMWPFWHVGFLAGVGLTLATSPLIIGAVLIPIAAGVGAVKSIPSPKYPGRTILAWSWPWMWLWGNSEDGIDGSANGFWPVTHGFELWKQIFAWSALRNSIGNARWLPFFGMTVRDPSILILPGGTLKEGPYIARQDARFELKFCWNPKQPDWTRRRYFWVGHRMAQQTVITFGVGFACQPWSKL